MQNKINTKIKIVGFLFTLFLFIPTHAFAVPWHISSKGSYGISFSSARGHIEIFTGIGIDFGPKPVTQFDWSIPKNEPGMDPITLDRGEVTVQIDPEDGTDMIYLPVTVSDTSDEYVVHAAVPNYTGNHYMNIRYFVSPLYRIKNGQAQFSYPIINSKNGIFDEDNSGDAIITFGSPNGYRDAILPSNFSCFLGKIKQDKCLFGNSDYYLIANPPAFDQDYFVNVSVPQESVLFSTSDSLKNLSLPSTYDPASTDPVDAVYTETMPKTSAPWKFGDGIYGSVTFDPKAGSGHLNMIYTNTVDFGGTPVNSFDWVVRRKGTGMNPIIFDEPPAVYLDDPSYEHPVFYKATVVQNSTDDFYIMHVSIPGWSGQHILNIVYYFMPKFDFSGDRASFTFPYVLAQNGNIETTRQNFLIPTTRKNASSTEVVSFITCFLGKTQLKDCVTKGDKVSFVELPETFGQDLSFHIDVPKEVVFPIDGLPRKNLPAFSPATTNHPDGQPVIKDYVLNGLSAANEVIPFSAKDKEIITLVYLAGFFLQILYSAISRKLSFKRILMLIGMTLLIFIFGILPGKHETAAQYNIFSHVFFGTIIAGIAVAAFFKEKFAPKINEFTFLIWSIILPYLLFSENFSNAAIFLSAIPFILAVINIYTDVDRFKKMRVFFYFLFILILIAGSLAHIHGSDTRFFENQNAWYPYTTSSFFFFGMLIAYVTPYIGFLFQFFPGKHEAIADYTVRRQALVESFSSNFNYLENFPKIYTIVGLGVIFALYLNYRYHFVSVAYTVTIIMILSQIIDRILGEKILPSDATAQNAEI